MKGMFPTPLFLVTALFLSAFGMEARAANVLTPCFLKVSLYTNILGTTVAELTGDAKYPNSPNEIRFLRSFNTRDALPTDALEDFGGRIEGLLTPQESGEYHFFLRSDKASELWLSTDESEANAILIAEETDSGDAFMEPDAGDAATSLAITLTAGKRYFIMALYKGSGGANGNSTDYAKVAWRKVGDTTPAASLKPIPGAFLSTLADDSRGPSVTITQQPTDVTGEENSRASFAVAANATPTNYVCIQWQRNGVSIPGATGTNYTRFLDKADNGAKFRAVVAVPGAFTNSTEATVTVTDDRTRPVLLAAKGGPNRPEVTLTFSERVDAVSAIVLANYRITSPTGVALGVTEAAVSADRTQVTLKTDPQVIGTQYTVTVNNVSDLAVGTPNAVAANSQATFYARGPWLQGDDGFVVWEAEDYDRNLDGLWFEDTERGAASGGVSMVNPNGAGGGNGTMLEYDIIFTKTGTNIIWCRASGNDGNDDSVLLNLDGQPPAERMAALSGLTGFGTSLNATYAWGTSVQNGTAPMTFVVDTPGLHAIGIARREDGTYVDKFVITTDPGFNPTTVFGTFGPPVTLRQGEPAPAGATVEITANPVNTQGLENASITLSAAAAVPAGVLFSYQWQRKQGNAFADIAGAASTNLTINPLTMDWNGAVVRMRVIASGVTKFTTEATITVIPETSVPTLVRATGSATQVSIIFSEPVTAATAQSTANYKIDGPSGALAVTSATLSPGRRIVFLETAAQTVGAKYTVTVNGVADTAATPNVIVNAQVKFYSLGALLPQDADGLLVFEAERFARNLDGLWTEDTSRGNPSSGSSVVVRTGGTEPATQLEYDLTFTKTGTNILWYRASGNDGGSDSAWFWIDGGRPTTRTNGNQASMTGFSGQLDFVWLSQPQDGGGQMTFNIGTAGPHTIGLGRRENNAFFDKFVITTNASFNPNDYGPFGPPETREGAPALPTLTITSPSTNDQFTAGANVDFTVAISQTSRGITKVEYFAGANKIGEASTSPFSFTWQNAPAGTNNITARLTDDVGDSVRARPVTLSVSASSGGPPPKFTSVSLQGPNVILEWTGAGKLQSTPSLPAQWTDVPNATSPFSVARTAPQQFYRLVQ